MKIQFEGTPEEYRAWLQAHGAPASFQPAQLEDLLRADTINIDHRAPRLAPEPVAPDSPPGATEFTMSNWSTVVPMPQNDATALSGKVNLPKIASEVRAAAWATFKSFCSAWVENFGVEGEQPNRPAMMVELGQGRYVIPILVMAYEIGSLQRLVEKALQEQTGVDYDLAWIGEVAANMVQVSHMGFPDLMGTYDYSERWLRVSPAQNSTITINN